MSSTPKPFRIHPERQPVRRQALSIGITLVLTLLLAVVINQFVFQSYFVDGESMSPTLHSNDRLIVSRVERTIGLATSGKYVPERGQIIVINGEASPASADRAPELIKRVIGLPGETIVIKNGNITVLTKNNGAIDPDELLGLSLEDTYSANTIEVTIPNDSVYVIGDNRSPGGSLDSRSFGPVKTKFIDGRLLIRIMPFDSTRVF